MKCQAPAKINLSLDVMRKREDGYHELCMIMQTISIYDQIDIEKDETISIKCDKQNIPTDSKNTAYKAANEFFDYTKISGGCKINIKKNIPFGAGMGGGSSDAAEVILALNELYNTNLTEKEMCEIAVKVGADVPFFILKGTCVAEGIGEKLKSIDNNLTGCILVCMPDFQISTKWVYENLSIKKMKTYDINTVISSIKKGDKITFGKNIFNVLEDVSVNKYKEIENIKSIMKNKGAYAALMTGSGSAVFGIYDDELQARKAADGLKNYSIFLAKFI